VEEQYADAVGDIDIPLPTNYTTSQPLYFSTSPQPHAPTTVSILPPQVPTTVSILPESLMSGAISAVSTAINTAGAVINRIRSPQEETATERQLHDMGFKNRSLNSQLLEKHNNNIEKVVEELLFLQEAPIQDYF